MDGAGLGESGAMENVAGAVRAVRIVAVLVLLLVAAGPARGQEGREVYGLNPAVGDAIEAAEKNGTFLLRADHAFAVAAVDLSTVATALLEARRASLAEFLRHAANLELHARHPLPDAPPPAPLGALLLASLLIGNELPKNLTPNGVAVAIEADGWPEKNGFLRLPASWHMGSGKPTGVFQSRRSLMSFFMASSYLRMLDDDANADARALLHGLLTNPALAGAVDELRRHHAITRRLFGEAAPHLFDDPTGSMVPQIKPPDDLLGEEDWMLDERTLALRAGAEHACLWLGRVFDAEACRGLGWPATQATTKLPAGMRSSARSLLVAACGENARVRELPAMLAPEGARAWARRRLVASTALYTAMRAYDGVDIMGGPLTALPPPPPPPPRVLWLVEPVPEVFDALAAAYDELEYCATALGQRIDLLGSRRAFTLLADCARSAAAGEELDDEHAALVKGFVERSDAYEDLPPHWLQLNQLVSVRSGALTNTETTIVWNGEQRKAATCTWSMRALHGSTFFEQKFDTNWRDIESAAPANR